jgi:hypothetical protein
MPDNEQREGFSAVLETRLSEAEIDETLIQTFPASDPPQWMLGVEHRFPPSRAVKSPS